MTTKSEEKAKVSAKDQKSLDSLHEDGSVTLVKGTEQDFSELIQADGRFDKSVWNYVYNENDVQINIQK